MDYGCVPVCAKSEMPVAKGERQKGYPVTGVGQANRKTQPFTMGDGS